MFTKEALELIQQTAQKAAQCEHVCDSPDGRFSTYRLGDRLERIDTAPPPRRHTVDAIEDLLAYAKRLLAGENTGLVVWHATGRITLVVDDQDRRDRVDFELNLSPVIRRLAELGKGQVEWFVQPAFIRLLRIELALGAAPEVAQFRRLDWSEQKAAVSDFRHGNEKLGKEIAARVQGVAELPEEIFVPVQAYENLPEGNTFRVLCAVEIDAINQRLALTPMTGELTHLLRLTHAEIQKLLEDGLREAWPADKGALPVYYGSP